MQPDLADELGVAYVRPGPTTRRANPVLGLNRAALLVADRVLMPLAAELFSLRGLSNLGPVLRQWRGDWQDLVLPRAKGAIAKELPMGVMAPYQSLMPLAHDARKPMFDLRPSDGAIGGTADFVQRCYEEFHELALEVAGRLGLNPSQVEE